ncbi:MAG: hypothetical protein H0V03_00350 [Thermoleophilaceae bacterium]|nr:hypothetical protein [Thermoleophilaceae bacterium]
MDSTADKEISRRRFLQAGTGAVLAAGGLAGAAAALPAPITAEGADGAPGPLRKCISLSGPAPVRSGRHPNDYCYWGTPDYFRQSGTTWVKLWVSWADLQPEYRPRSRAESWFDLNMAPLGKAWLWRLDRQVRAANDDGLGVILSLYHAFPRWANGADGDDPDSARSASQRLPRDLSADGPWGWWVSYLCARYSGKTNPLGPHEPFPGEDASGYDARSGNPAGARVDALEVCNEPNVLFWPQERIAASVATMIRSGVRLSGSAGPRILGPSTLDSPDPGEAPAPRVRTDWRSFTTQVLDELRREPAPGPFGWTHHNYRDVKRAVAAPQSRVRQVVDLVRAGSWPDRGRPLLWLTEAGLNVFPDQQDQRVRRLQAERIRRNFLEMSRLPDVYLWTQHGLSDIADNPFKSGLRDDFRAGAHPRPGPARPALRAWAELPGAQEP